MRSGGLRGTLAGVAFWEPGTMTLTSAQKAIPKATSPPPRSQASPRRPDRNGRLDFSPSGSGRSPTTSRCAHHSMASRCTRPPAQAGSTPRVERPCCDMSCDLRLRKSEWSNALTASFASPSRRLTKSAKPALGAWDGRGRHGSVIAPLSARHQRASATLSHNPLRRGPRRREPVALAARAASAFDRGGCRARKEGAQERISPLG